MRRGGRSAKGPQRVTAVTARSLRLRSVSERREGHRIRQAVKHRLLSIECPGAKFRAGRNIARRRTSPSSRSRADLRRREDRRLRDASGLCRRSRSRPTRPELFHRRSRRNRPGDLCRAEQPSRRRHTTWRRSARRGPACRSHRRRRRSRGGERFEIPGAHERRIEEFEFVERVGELLRGGRAGGVMRFYRSRRVEHLAEKHRRPGRAGSGRSDARATKPSEQTRPCTGRRKAARSAAHSAAEQASYGTTSVDRASSVAKIAPRPINATVRYIEKVT